jgi:hypothetical protein
VVAQGSNFKRAPLGAVDRDFTEGTLTSTVGFPGTFIELVPTVDPATGETSIGKQVFLDPACGAPGTDSFPDATGDRCMFDYRVDIDGCRTVGGAKAVATRRRQAGHWTGSKAASMKILLPHSQ